MANIYGGNGGDLGQDGEPTTGEVNVHSPGKAGKAIIGKEFITWANKGDIRGDEVDSTEE